MPSLHTLIIPTPLGDMLAGAGDAALVFLMFVDDASPTDLAAAQARRFKLDLQLACTPLLEGLARELDDYFSRKLRAFSIPLAPRGTPFQHQVWSALQTVEHGQTRSYLDLARAINRPTATRAVANANGDNPIALLIPCHRIIGSDGLLTGYAGGLWRKQALLEIEGALRQRSVEQTLFSAATD